MENAEALNGINIVPFEQAAVVGLELTLGVLLFMMSFMLLIACAKVANSRPAHSSGPTAEIAAATAPGSASKRMLQLLGESFLLVLVGGGVGLYFAEDGIRTALAVFPAEVLRFESIGINSYLLLFALIVPLLAIVLFALPRIRIIRRLLSPTSVQKKAPPHQPLHLVQQNAFSSAPRSS